MQHIPGLVGEMSIVFGVVICGKTAFLPSHFAADRIDVIRLRDAIVNHHTKKTIFRDELGGGTLEFDGTPPEV